jgi:hypothetical protein
MCGLEELGFHVRLVRAQRVDENSGVRLVDGGEAMARASGE